MTKRRYFNVLEVLTENSKVETRDKCEAKITSFHFPSNYPIFGYYKDKEGTTHCAAWNIFGKLLFGPNRTPHDLFMKGKFYVPRKQWKEQRV